jgi:hypothetical protein
MMQKYGHSLILLDIAEADPCYSLVVGGGSGSSGLHPGGEEVLLQYRRFVRLLQNKRMVLHFHNSRSDSNENQ